MLDHRSRNGTILNGRKVEAGVLQALKHGDRLALGSLKVAVSIAADAACAGGTRTRFRELLGSADLSETDAGAFLVVVNGPGAGASAPLDKDACTVGRAATCSLQIPDRQISARHFTVGRRDGAWTLEDAGSRNGTRVSGKRIRRRGALKDGDLITAGGTRILFCEGAAGEGTSNAAPKRNAPAARAAGLYAAAAMAALGSAGLAAAIVYCVFG